jgi:hypothetical protein
VVVNVLVGEADIWVYLAAQRLIAIIAGPLSILRRVNKLIPDLITDERIAIENTVAVPGNAVRPRQAHHSLALHRNHPKVSQQNASQNVRQNESNKESLKSHRLRLLLGPRSVRSLLALS